MANIKIFSRYIPMQLVLLWLAEFVASFAAFYAGIHMRFHGDTIAIYGDLGPIYSRALIFALFMSFSLVMMGQYRSRQRPSCTDVVVRVFVAAIMSTIAMVIVFYVYPTISTGRGALALIALVAVFSILALRILFFKFVDGALFRRRVLVLGAGERATSLALLRRKSDQRSFRIVGFVPSSGETIRAECEGRLIQPDDIERFVRKEQIHEIVVALDDRRTAFPNKALLNCRLKGTPISEITTFIERETGRIDVGLLHPGWLIFGEGFRSGVHDIFLKRLVDFLISLFMLTLAAPIFMITAIAIFLEDGYRHGIVYRQRRVGFQGKPFDILKFRSMRGDAEATSGAAWAISGDPRVTVVGRIIRRLRIDELPQLINILSGEMSFVGARPERPEFVEKLRQEIPYYDGRHCLKPGLTGWAQVSFPYGSSVQDARTKLEYDLYYVKHATFMFDMLIILQTLDVVMWKKGMAMSQNAYRKTIDRTGSIGTIDTIRDDVVQTTSNQAD